MKHMDEHVSVCLSRKKSPLKIVLIIITCLEVDSLVLLLHIACFLNISNNWKLHTTMMTISYVKYFWPSLYCLTPIKKWCHKKNIYSQLNIF